MNPEGIMLSEISHTEKDKYRMISLVCVIWKTNELAKQNRNRLRDTENKQVAARGENAGVGGQKGERD